MSAEAGKRRAALAAAARVTDGVALGLGTGSTIAYLIEELGRRRREEGLRVACLPTSVRSGEAARREGLEIIGFDTCERLDLAIDGADEVVEGPLHLIKGLGGALLREKIVAANSARFIVVADAGKMVRHLGEKAPLPVEVAPFGYEAVARRLAAMGGAPVLRMEDGAAYRTDNDHFILHCGGFGPIADPAALDAALRVVPGVMETGLFVGMATEAYVADADGVRCLVRENPFG